MQRQRFLRFTGLFEIPLHHREISCSFFRIQSNFPTKIDLGPRDFLFRNTSSMRSAQENSDDDQHIFSNLYVSEGRNPTFINDLLDFAKEKTEATLDCAIVSSFSDTYYNRTSVTLAGNPSSVIEVIKELGQMAVTSLDLRNHCANHPRIGVVDHISIHPLCTKDTSSAKNSAIQLGKFFGQELGIPILYYGDVNGKRLAAIRRSTSYFSGGQDTSINSDEGPCDVPEHLGMMCIGAVPAVLNYNIRFKSTDRSLVSKITRAIREKDGGLAKVEAITLEHENGYFEAACNLLDINETSPNEVLNAAQKCAHELNVEVDNAYTIGFTPQQIFEKYQNQIARRFSS